MRKPKAKGKKATKPLLEWSRLAVLAVAAVVAFFLAIQLLTPDQKPIAMVRMGKAVKRTAQARNAREAEGTAVEPNAGGAEAAAPQDEIRDLFQPLVVVAKSGRAGAALSAPVLPPAGGAAGGAPALPPAGPAAAEVGIRPQSTGEITVQNLQMVGVVQLGDQPQVLIRNNVTGQSRQFRRGEDAYGFTVRDIREAQVSLEKDGQLVQLAMSSDTPIEGSNGSSVAAASGFTGGRFGGGFGGGRFGGEGNSGGGRRMFGDPNVAPVFAAANSAEALKKLEEVRSKLEPDQYERLKGLVGDAARFDRMKQFMSRMQSGGGFGGGGFGGGNRGGFGGGNGGGSNGGGQ
jgi:uncharacterized membrane protein YgcG